MNPNEVNLLVSDQLIALFRQLHQLSYHQMYWQHVADVNGSIKSIRWNRPVPQVLCRRQKEDAEC